MDELLDRPAFREGSPQERLGSYTIRVPEGTIHDWRVHRIEVDETRARELTLQDPTRPVLPGIYTRLAYQRQTMQIAYPSWVRDHYRLLANVHGHVLMAGLGLGVVARQVLLLPEVVQLTIIEKEWAVIRLVKPALVGEFGDRVRIIQDDVTRGRGRGLVGRLDGRPWDTVWYDIWPGRGPQVTDVHLIRWLVENAKKHLLAPPAWQGAPRRYELVAEYKHVRHKWKNTIAHWGTPIG